MNSYLPRRTVLLTLLGLSLALPVSAATATRTSAFTYDATSGLLVKEIVEPDNSDLCLVTEYLYDGYGNKVSASTRNCNGTNGEASAPTGDAVIAPRGTATTYDARGQFPVSSSNALSQSETKTFDPKFGNVLSLTGPNGLTTTWTYDGFGRKTLETRADGTQTQWEYLYCSGVNNGSAPCPTVGGVSGAYVIVTTPLASDGVTPTGPVSKTYYDSLDRPTRSETQGFDGTGASTALYQDTHYDSLGRPYKKSRPYYAGQSAYWTTITYDSLGRPIQVADADGTLTSTAYNGLTSTVTNPGNQTRTTVKNSQGQVVTVTDAQNQTLGFQYDPFGNLTRSTDPQGNIVVLTYDLRGRKTQMQDPDMGTWSYAYNALGQLVRQTDAQGQVSTLAYDTLGRLVSRSEADLISAWYYDTYKGGGACAKGIGKLCQAETSTGYNRTHSYDSLGRATGTTTQIDVTYTSSVTYDANGRVATQTYPGGVSLTHVYTALGYLKEVRDAASNALYWQADSLDAEGHLLQQTYGNNVQTQHTYNPANGRLTGIVAVTVAGPMAGTSVQNLAYQYDSLGNLTSREDANQTLIESFTYDTLNRLQTATVNASAVSPAATTTFTYDALGNILSRSDLGTYTYPTGGAASVRPHAVSRIDLAGGGYRTYSYDANGNLATEAQYDASNTPLPNKGRTEVYTSFNMPLAFGSPGISAAFAYGPEHQRVRQISSSNGTTIYLNPGNNGELSYEKDIKPDASIEQRSFITAYGQVVAMVKQVSSGGTTTTVVRYLHRDNLSSTTTVTDEAGAVIERLAYEPFGKRRFPQGPTDPNNTLVPLNTERGFTNHEHVDELGLIHMNGRVYDPLIGRFVSPDPFIQDPYNLQAYNRYAYVWNNPLNSTDPSGYFKFGSFFRTVVAIAAAYYLGPGGSAALFSSQTTAAIIANSAVAGFAAGAIQTGSLQGGLQGAFSGVLFAGAGKLAGLAGFGEDTLGRAMFHAGAGCLSAEASGGDCGRGALSAGFTKFVGANTMPANPDRLLETIRWAAIGGTASVIGGGKFANGAVTGSFQYLVNQSLEKKPPFSPRELDPEAQAIGIGTVRITASDFQQIQSKHDPRYKIRDWGSVFDSDLTRNYDTFIDRVVDPGFSPGNSPLTVIQGPRGELWWERSLPFVVGLDASGRPTNTVRFVLRYDWGQSLSSFSSIWSVTGAFPVEKR
ncbi:MAG: type IV secretion protein Rhs [Rhodocyclaceae bacterium]|nr:type IV secretion protein Rhs [Rhodocyclaceae bacterium]